MSKCTKCGEMKHKEYSRSVSRSTTGWTREIYLDEKGRQWTYNRCPDCKLKKYNKDIKKPAPPKPKTQRYCLRCKKPLKINYFYHKECLEIVENAVGYGYSDSGGPKYIHAKAF